VRDDPAKETTMETKESERTVRSVEQQNRLEALSHAVRHRMREENPTEVVEAAKKYFEFLQS
jgi:hypothetical protein